uniref:Metalloendopeptidase n=1 Tax=Homalodisca liturata TaxID=320908 RepID=A0A1B6HU16_9HEMI
MMLILLSFLVGVSFCSSRSLEVAEDFKEYSDLNRDEERSETEKGAEWTDEWYPDPQQNIWELSGFFEGDIVEDDEDYQHRNGLLDTSYRWPRGVVPFDFSPEFNTSDKRIVYHAMNEIETKTCIDFRPRSRRDIDYVIIQDNRTKPGCYSSVGRKGNRQHVNLARPRCMKHGVIMHELLHALGLYHQQSASNRDQYVQINWQNIKEGRERNFCKYLPSTTSSFGVPYDYSSIMHYSAHAFSRNRQPTITPLKSGVEIGQRISLSPGDVAKLNIMYGCRTSG